MGSEAGATLGIGMVGYAFMGAAHSQGWRNVASFFEVPLRPSMVALCGRDAEAATAAASRMGWASVETDWKRLIARDDVALVDICTPGDSHAEIAIAALEAGKHVVCEKPLANTVAEAEAMAAAAERASASGTRSMVNFNYRRVPALALARRFVESGKLGTIRHVRAQYLQDWIVDPEFPLVWRLQKERAGSGALGDIGAHIIDIAQFVTGQQLTGVSALTETFVTERPVLEATAGGLAAQAGKATGPVTVDDCALFIGRFSNGAVATFEATRFASGRKNGLHLEINGSGGSIVFDLEALNELQFFDRTEPAETAGFRRILVTESVHPYAGAWWPPGHIIGWEHTFTHAFADFLGDVAEGRQPHPSFAEGLQVQRALAAVEASAAAGSSWVEIEK